MANPGAGPQHRGQHRGQIHNYLQRLQVLERLNSSNVVDEEFDDDHHPVTGEPLDRTLYNTGRKRTHES